MKSHHDLSDNTFEHLFATATLDPSLFNHEAHLRLAWIHVNRYGVDQAVENICSQIQVFDATFGDGTKYNATVTAAAVRAVNHFLQKTKTTSFTRLHPGKPPPHPQPPRPTGQPLQHRCFHGR